MSTCNDDGAIESQNQTNDDILLKISADYDIPLEELKHRYLQSTNGIYSFFHVYQLRDNKQPPHLIHFGIKDTSDFYSLLETKCVEPTIDEDVYTFRAGFHTESLTIVGNIKQ